LEKGHGEEKAVNKDMQLVLPLWTARA
jgi:hypothetical protein